MGDTVHGDKVKGDKVNGNKFVVHQGRSGKKPIPILLMSANPYGTALLRIDEEHREIRRALQPAHKRVSTPSASAVRLGDVQHELLQHGPAIVHFSGHGLPGGASAGGRGRDAGPSGHNIDGSAGIVVLDDHGFPCAVPPDALTNLFGILNRALMCVFLNACFTDDQASAIARHVPCVVGMHSRVLDDTAIRFASGFYEGLAYGRTFRESFALGRAKLRMYGQPDDHTPVFIATDPAADRRLFDDDQSRVW
jgi:hypothetical protein